MPFYSYEEFEEAVGEIDGDEMVDYFHTWEELQEEYPDGVFDQDAEFIPF